MSEIDSVTRHCNSPASFSRLSSGGEKEMMMNHLESGNFKIIIQAEQVDLKLVQNK